MPNLSFGCTDSDGVPFTDPTIVQTCCTNNNGTWALTPMQPSNSNFSLCYSGLTGMVATGVSGASNLSIMAGNNLAQAQAFLGQNVDISGSAPNSSSTQSSLTNGGAPDPGAYSGVNSVPAGSSAAATGPYSGVGSQGGSGGAGSSGGGSSGGGAGALNIPSEQDSSNALNVAAVAAKGSGTGWGGSVGKDGSRDGSAATAMGTGSAVDGQFSFGANAAKRELASSTGADEDAIGTTLDPSDYFMRIAKGESLFRIVSTRYQKKKSLWTTQSN